MIDAEDAIRSELERLAPSDERMQEDWDAVVERSRASTQPRRPRFSSRRLVIAVAVLGVAALGPAVAFSSGVRNFLGWSQPRPELVHAQLILSAPVGNGFYAHLWHSPSTTGGICSFTSIDHQPTPRRASMNGGGGCGARSNHVNQAPASHPLLVGVAITRRLSGGTPTRWVPPIVSGDTAPELHATRVAVEWHGGSYPLAVHNGYFLGGTPRLYMPPFSKFPFYVVAFDSTGREVARSKIDSPSLLLMTHGWKQYAREYRTWKKTHRR